MEQEKSEKLLAFVYAKEAYHQSKKQILALTGTLVGLWGVVNSLLNRELGWQVLSALVAVGLLYSIWAFCSWFSRIKKGRMSIKIFHNRDVTLLRNDFQENMNYLLHSMSPEELDKFAFVMGIDRTGNLSISSEGGVVHWVLKYLNENYMCGEKAPLNYIQEELDKYMDEHPHAEEMNKLAYGTCVEVELNLQPIIATENKEVIPCNLVLIANSRKEVPNEKNLEERMKDDDMSNIIVPKVFDYLLSTNWYTGAMIGVMGTNGMRQAYQVVFSQIINQYARICYKEDMNPLSRLFISIREKDYRKRMTLSQLEQYVRQCAHYYTTTRPS